jgi:hypothetical protein
MASDTRPTEPRLDALAWVLDEIVPRSADGRMRGAGEIGLAPVIASLPDVAAILEPGLEEVEALARAAGYEHLRDVPKRERRGLLEATTERQPSFVPTLVARTFIAYYQQPEVLDAIGIGAGPLYPRGFEVAPTDFAILDPVRGRAPIYRMP